VRKPSWTAAAALMQSTKVTSWRRRSRRGGARDDGLKGGLQGADPRLYPQVPAKIRPVRSPGGVAMTAQIRGSARNGDGRRSVRSPAGAATAQIRGPARNGGGWRRF
jgi:hypothetical protein